jgi:hypothetical protein
MNTTLAQRTNRKCSNRGYEPILLEIRHHEAGAPHC